MDLRGFRISLRAGRRGVHAHPCSRVAIPWPRPRAHRAGSLLSTSPRTATVPSPGKRIEVVGVSLSQTTDANGLAPVRPAQPAGPHVVRAYDIGIAGAGAPFVEQGTECHAGADGLAWSSSDCVLCR